MKKLLSVLLAIFILSLCVVPVAASAQRNNWILSEDGETLTDGEKVYEKYTIPVDVNYLPEGTVYLYEIESQHNEYYSDYVAVTESTDEIVRLHYSGEIYVTEKGKDILNEFRNGEYSFYLYYADDEYTVIDFTEADFSMFIKEENKTELDVSSIWKSNITEVRGFDKTGTFAHDCGAVYEVKGEFYYIDFDSLDNSYFDSYGAFSYRKGIVPAYKLDQDAVELVKSVNYSSKVRIEEYIYPDEELFLTADDDLSATITFWVISVLIGLVIPAVPFVLSIKFAHSKKSVNPKKWYILTVCCAVWILVSVGMVLTFIL